MEEDTQYTGLIYDLNFNLKCFWNGVYSMKMVQTIPDCAPRSLQYD